MMGSVDSKKLRDKVFDFVYNMSLHDATLQMAYEGDISELNNREMKTIIREYIDNILVPKKDIKVDEVINKVVNASNDGGFTFGNAQKLVNMTAKYMYLSCYDDMSKRDLFEDCHCPMDRIMIKCLTGRIREQHDGKMPDDYKLPDGSKGWSSVSWSKITEKHTKDKTDVDVYNTFQEMARDLADDMGVSPLELDILLW